MRTPALVFALSMVLGSSACGQAPAYDAEPLLALLKAPARAGIEEHLGVASLAELPLYEIDQAIDEGSASFEGRLTLHWTNRTGAAVTVLPLRLHPNSPEELGAAAGGSGSLHVSEVVNEVGPACTFASPRATLVEVRFAEPVAAGGRIRLKIRYGGRLRTLTAQANDVFAQGMSSMGSITGAGAADYGLVGVGDGIITLASAYPMVAPFRRGEFDVDRPTRYGDLAYNDMMNFKVRTIVPTGTTVCTNLVDDAAQAAKSGTDVIVSRGALVRDFVLVAGRDLVTDTRMVGETRVNSVCRSRDRKAGLRALGATAASLSVYEKRFGPYPYAELDVAEATLVGGAGGVEFCGMVLIAGMFYRPPSKSTSQLKMLMDLWGALGSGLTEGLDGKTPGKPAGNALDDEMFNVQFDFTVAHEVAHQYFAGLVGNDSHRYPSLDEPLAQYAAGLAMEDLVGAAAAKSAMDGNVKLNYALYRVLSGPDAPVMRDVNTFRSGIEYAGLVYGKAPYLYVALRQALGEDRLHAAMRTTIQANRFRILTTPEWIAALEQAAGGPESGVRALAKRWLEEAHGDEDLQVDEDGEFVFEAMFDKEVARTLRDTYGGLGMKPGDLLRMLFGGGLSGDLPGGPGLDPEKALKMLEELGK